MRTGWGSSPSADGCGPCAGRPRWLRSDPTVAGYYVHAFVRPGTGKAGTGCCPPAFNLRQVRLAGTPPGGVGLVFCPLLA